MNKKDRIGIIICIICIIILTLIIIVSEITSYINNSNWVNYLLSNNSRNYTIEKADGKSIKLNQEEIEEILNKYKDATFETGELCFDEWKDNIYPKLSIVTSDGSFTITSIGKNYIYTNDDALKRVLNATEKESEELSCNYKAPVYIASFDITEELEKYSN